MFEIIFHCQKKSLLKGKAYFAPNGINSKLIQILPVFTILLLHLNSWGKFKLCLQMLKHSDWSLMCTDQLPLLYTFQSSKAHKRGSMERFMKYNRLYSRLFAQG